MRRLLAVLLIALVAAGIFAPTTAHAETGRENTHTLVSANEADPAGGKLSVESPLAVALAGARVGDAVAFEAPRGTRRLVITAIA